ncbi:hypothetical protein [Burkholderia multivorans]
MREPYRALLGHFRHGIVRSRHPSTRRASAI